MISDLVTGILLKTKPGTLEEIHSLALSKEKRNPQHDSNIELLQANVSQFQKMNIKGIGIGGSQNKEENGKSRSNKGKVP